MKPLVAYEVSKLIDGILIKGSNDLQVTGAIHFTKAMNKPNMLLFVLVRRQVNWEVVSKYTPCVVVTDSVCKEMETINDCTIILVEDIETAYWKFVDYLRSQFSLPVIAVTGTCGKTTTKDMIKHILKFYFNVTGTERSANGSTGELRSLLSIDENTEVGVFETAVRQPGDITRCCRYFKPKIGVITNIGIDHLEGCKTLEGYIEAKSEIVDCLDKDGILIINGDDENTRKIAVEKYSGRIVRFGIHEPCQFRASDILYSENGMKFTLTFQNLKYSILVPGYGQHQVYNALAAIAAVHELGIGINEASRLLESYNKLPFHLQLKKIIHDCLMIDDTWNININSLKAAIKTLNDIANGKKRLALIGDMDLLGDLAEEIHQQAGYMIANTGGLDILITVGPLASHIAKGAAEAGFSGETYIFPSTDGLYEFLDSKLNENSILLIKCSYDRDRKLIELKQKLEKAAKEA